MSHLLDAWLAASRAGNAALAADIADSSVSVNAMPQLKESSVAVMQVVRKPKPIVVRPPSLAPPSIIPPRVDFPTAVLVGGEQNGGQGIPNTIGPRSIANIVWPIGSMLFYIGNRVAVSIGIYESGDSMRDLLVNYHRRGVRLKVHTGIGSASKAGVVGRNEGPGGVGGEDEAGALVPYGRPLPPKSIAGGTAGEAIERWQSLDRASPSQGDPWVDIIPGWSLPFKRPSVGQLEDTLRYFGGIADALGIVL